MIILSDGDRLQYTISDGDRLQYTIAAQVNDGGEWHPPAAHLGTPCRDPEPAIEL